jgi:hypothetical protein
VGIDAIVGQAGTPHAALGLPLGSAVLAPGADPCSLK